MRSLVPVIVTICIALIAVACAGSEDDAADEVNAPGGLLSAEDVLTQGAAVPFQECFSDPDWVQPSFEEEWLTNELLRVQGYADEQQASAIYERRIFMLGPGEAVNKVWSGFSGLPFAGDPPGCSTAFQRGTSGGRIAAFALVYYRPVAVMRKGSDLVVTLRGQERGWTVMELTLDPPATDALTAYFLDENGRLLLTCRSVGCDP